MADRFNTRRLRHRLAVLIAAVLAAGGAIGLLPAQHAAAQDSCQQDDAGAGWICQWSQIDNGNWPESQQSDPDCHSTCDYYLHGNCQSYYYADNVSLSRPGVDFRGDIERAVRNWSGRPYCSPFFYNCNCGNAFMTLNDATLVGAEAGYCGVGDVTSAWDAGGQQYDNHVVASHAEYNDQPIDGSGDNIPWYDGKPDSYNGQYCDAIMTSVHEVGHAMTEGHSSYPDDVMCASPPGQLNCHDVTQIDADANNMLNAVYGPYHNNSTSGSGGPNCNGCEMACPQTTGVTTSTGTDPTASVNQTLWTICGTVFNLPDTSGYWAKAWDIFQGVSVPNLPQDITQNPCSGYFAQKQLVPWINCETGNPIA
jgi:hypothetical protein